VACTAIARADLSSVQKFFRILGCGRGHSAIHSAPDNGALILDSHSHFFGVSGVAGTTSRQEAERLLCAFGACGAALFHPRSAPRRCRARCEIPSMAQFRASTNELT
jgi:hypothetical protein